MKTKSQKRTSRRFSEVLAETLSEEDFSRRLSVLSPLIVFPLNLSLNEQRHFYANKAKTQVCHFRLKRYKTRYMPVKRDKETTRISSGFLGSYEVQGMVSIQNEIGTILKFA